MLGNEAIAVAVVYVVVSPGAASQHVDDSEAKSASCVHVAAAQYVPSGEAISCPEPHEKLLEPSPHVSRDPGWGRAAWGGMERSDGRADWLAKGCS